METKKELQDKFRKLESEIEDLEYDIDYEEDKLDDMEREIRDMKKKLEKKQDELCDLEELIEKMPDDELWNDSKHEENPNQTKLFP